MSLCDSCFAPGACCKRINFKTGSKTASFWADESVEDQLRAIMHADDAARPFPFVVLEMGERYTDPESGREYVAPTFTCSNLTPEGRCGDYENRPWLCRDFEPAMDALCVHYQGAEGGTL